MQEIKDVFRSIFTRDVRAVEPGKTGLIVGDNLRVYKEKSGYVVSFLKGTDNNGRKHVTDKLDEAKVKYKVGADFET